MRGMIQWKETTKSINMKTFWMYFWIVFGLLIYVAGCAESSMSSSLLGAIIMLPGILEVGNRIWPETKQK